MRENRALTGLRGVGALAVLAYHMCIDLHIGSLDGVLLRGYLAVDMFFVLSGFVMAGAYGDIFARDGSARAYGRFLGRRLARLWPLHLAVLSVVLLCQLAGLGPVAWPNQIVTNVFMIQSWGLSQSIVVPDWSVSTEWAACLLFPLLARFTLYGSRRSAIVSLGAAVAVLAAIMVLAQYQANGRRGLLDIYDGWSLLPLARCLAGVAIGMLLHRVAGARTRPAWWNASWLAPGAAVLLVAGVVFRVPDPVLYPLLPVLIGGLALEGGGGMGRFLGSAAPEWIGRMSFAIYLVHQPLIDLMVRFGLNAWWPVLPLVVAGVAILAYAGVERPIRAWLNGGAGFTAPLQNAIS